MEVKALYGFTLLLILVGMIIGVGVLTLDKFGTSSMNAQTGANQTDLRVWTTNYTTTTHTTIDSASLTAVNSTDGVAVNLLCKDTTKYGCTSVKLVAPASANGSLVNLSYTYGKTSVTTTALSNARTEIGNISSTWLGLIVTIAILAIILSLVIGSFGRRD